MHESVRSLLPIVAWLLMPFHTANAEDSPRLVLDASTRAQCLEVLRSGMRGEGFWPSIHAAEGLTLGGRSLEVIEFLTPKLMTETDDQKRCGVAREIVRAGDRSVLSVLFGILGGDEPHGHVHAAESLFKVFEVGDGRAIRRAFTQNDNVSLKLMSAGGLARSGDAEALRTVRDLLTHVDSKHYAIAAWVLGQIGDTSDIRRLQAQLARCPDATTRANFEHALAILGDEDGLQALQKNLNNGDNAIRTSAATFAGDARAVGTAPQLQAMLADPFPDARIRAAQSLLVLAGPATLPFRIQASAIHQELSPESCWFHPRAAALPGHGVGGQPAVIVTIQKHLVASDHYSGLHFMRTDDLGQTWTGPTEIPELAWKNGENNETIGVCDVTPGWVSHAHKLLAVGIQLRYSAEGVELLDKPRSHACAYATFDPQTKAWTEWRTLDMPHETGKFYLVAPGCVQWLEKEDGSLLIPAYVRDPSLGRYTTTVLHCAFDGQEMQYLSQGDELTIAEGRGLYEPSLTRYGGMYYLTLRSDDGAYVSTSEDGLHFRPVRAWTFDDGLGLGSYNTQAHWLTHSDGLFLTYTRRGANNDHIMRNRAPLFVAQVDPVSLQVLRRTERVLLPERGVMLGNFGAAAITPDESWVTDSEYLVSDTPDPKGADGTTWLGRVKWSKPNQLVK